MKKDTAYIFIDEMKNGSLSSTVKCNNNYYCFAAVVVSERNLQLLRDIHNEILRTHFKNEGYLKSKSIKRKGIWVDIANRYKAVEHYVYFLAIDMDKLSGEGLNNSRFSFEKYFQNIINARFLELYDKSHVIMDDTGYDKFKSSIIRYMEVKGFGKTLFSDNSFTFKEDKMEEPLLQVADFYVGLIGRFMRRSEQDERLVDVYDIVRERTIMSYFPYREISLLNAENLMQDEFNQNIYNCAVDSAINYLDQHLGDDIEMDIVEHIVSESRIHPFRFVPAKEISKIIQIKYNKKNINPTLIMGGIRDKGVLIVSTKYRKAGGYKIPCNKAEIVQFYNDFIHNTVPQLRRMGIMNDSLLERTGLNILADEQYQAISKLVDGVKGTKLKLEEHV